MLVRRDVNLADFTTLGIGGPARYFIEATSDDEVGEGIAFAKAHDLAVFVLGGGSNILVSDRGFDGLVLRALPRGVGRPEETASGMRITVGAGEDWDGFVLACVDQGLAGIENLSGIPGLVGGTPVQNVGAYGQEVSDTIVSVRCLDRVENKVVDLTKAACGFSYRASVFNSSRRERYIVLAVTFQLQKGGAPNVLYKDLAKRFASQRPDLGEVRSAVLSIRRSKSMVIDRNDPNRQSAGSFFKNPVISSDKYNLLKERFGEVPSFPFADQVKVPAAWLIEKAGFHKGFEQGKAGISTNHTLALINRGGASASDIIGLKELIEDSVREEFGIDLLPEPVFVGF